MRLTFWVGFWAFLVDQASKYWLLYVEDFGAGDRWDILPPLLRFKYGENRGVNFGLFSDFDMRWVLVGVAIVICVFVIWWLRREKPGKWGYISAGLLVGGALGNVVDRVLYGFVFDFLNMSCCGINNPFVFNLADVFIFAGAIGLVLFTGNNDTKKTA
ncbi:MAG: signal peptidase II [Octadecabacter sp.]|nr:signal peptidase II [Octadecabacter sp.]